MGFQQLHLQSVQCFGYADSDSGPYSDCDAHCDAKWYSDTDSNPNWHASANSDANSNCHTYTNARSDSESHGYASTGGRHADVFAEWRKFPSTRNRANLLHYAGRYDFLHDQRHHADNQLEHLQWVRSDPEWKRQ